jgi:hypothetical protein
MMHQLKRKRNDKNEDDEEGDYCHSRYKKRFYKALPYEERCLRDRRIPRSSLQLPKVSSWHQLYQSDNDNALITLTGLNHATFNIIKELFVPVFDSHSPWIGRDNAIRPISIDTGRKRLINGVDCLGLGMDTNKRFVYGITNDFWDNWHPFECLYSFCSSYYNSNTTSSSLGIGTTSIEYTNI